MDNPFLDRSFQIRWSQLTAEQVGPAVEHALAAAAQAIDQMAALDPARADYAHTFLALEQATERLTETCLSERDVRRSAFSARTASPRETAAHPNIARPPEPRFATFGRGGEAHHE